jgi:hypothetical protein
MELLPIRQTNHGVQCRSSGHPVDVMIGYAEGKLPRMQIDAALPNPKNQIPGLCRQACYDKSEIHN